MATVKPNHYWIFATDPTNGNLDDLYKEGWRAVQMTAYSDPNDGPTVVLLLEKTKPPQKK